MVSQYRKKYTISRIFFSSGCKFETKRSLREEKCYKDLFIYFKKELQREGDTEGSPISWFTASIGLGQSQELHLVLTHWGCQIGQNRNDCPRAAVKQMLLFRGVWNAQTWELPPSPIPYKTAVLDILKWPFSHVASCTLWKWSWTVSQQGVIHQTCLINKILGVN